LIFLEFWFDILSALCTNGNEATKFFFALYSLFKLNIYKYMCVCIICSFAIFMSWKIAQAFLDLYNNISFWSYTYHFSLFSRLSFRSFGTRWTFNYLKITIKRLNTCVVVIKHSYNNCIKQTFWSYYSSHTHWSINSSHWQLKKKKK
jgi:hypothetical protein